jgi:MFS family permease
MDISVLTSLFYLGMGIGAIIGGKLGDLMGRVYFLKIGSLLQILFACLFFFISNSIELIITRILYGIGCGISLSLSTSITA